ncbi:hypothetical protein L6654_08930 [Bradyrhizobium sp. WYCCWR 13023]|uniref:Uncharacterized protein n=1 Tax=Bradyrhizobium zhengyangense TaxID=2911009 RepID=A0A9X1U6I7_9BRAD|nr:hypothetical protein [Bradyrhizobium zhengyangense]MCG2626745.1 hypothetical protein [Bradyrhizobium zhengyangense]MCG2638168.1 hypothetical protein [Bradyrhizobium zhengyangense]MCG2666567.1 hypothetical protein [Bradyrhizobium zhengyangense]
MTNDAVPPHSSGDTDQIVDVAPASELQARIVREDIDRSDVAFNRTLAQRKSRPLKA